MDELQALLDRVPAPLEPLDITMLDGFLCGVLLQPNHVAPMRWLPFVTDTDGRPLPPRFDASRLQALAQRRHAELNRAIADRQWFDPWVFEMEGDDEEAPRDESHDEDEEDDDFDEGGGSGSDAVYPWVAGFSLAMEHFPELMALDEKTLTEPLALLYRHLDPDDLEDADALLELIESLEPPADISESVEGLVRATLLMADLSRPLQSPGKPGSRPPLRRGPPPRRR